MTELKKESEIRWMKPGKSTTIGFMGKDLVVIASGVFIMFVETSRPEKKELLYHANNEVKGDGVTCVSTHPNLSCFAFAERCRNPRIMILSYPSFEMIRSFDSVTLSDYRTIRFSEMEYIVALTGIPNFKIVIWNWRTGDKLYAQDTELRSLNQILRVSSTSPVQIIQTTGEDRRLVFWDMNVCYKKTNVNQSSINLPSSTTPPYYFTYGADGDIYFVDSRGSLYSINAETHVCTEQYMFPLENIPDGFQPCITWYKGGIVFQTPIEVHFLRRKSPEGWTNIWSLTPKVPFKILMASSLKDLLVGVNIRNEVMIFKGDHQIELVVVKSFGADFEFVCFIYPVADYVVTFGNSWKTFNVWNKTTGTRVSQFPWTYDKIKALSPHPKMPYLVAVTAGGAVSAINAYDPQHLADLDRIKLTTNSLDEIRFRGEGTHFCVANTEIGEFFLLQYTTKLEVIAYVRLDLKIVDFALMEKDIHNACLLIVPMSQLCCRSGQTMLFYALHEKKKTLVQVKDIPLPSIITEILPSPASQKDLFCVYHRSRKFFVMNLLNGKVMQEFSSGHQMKFIRLKTDGEYLYSFGSDGLVVVRLPDAKECATLFYSHHRCSKGIKNLALDPCEGYVITLGETGGLFCAILKKLQRPERKPELEALMSSQTYKQLFLQAGKTKAMDKHETLKDTKPNWLAMRNQEIVNMEEQHNRKEKQSILEEFNSIKNKVCELLDENAANEPEKKLPINAFDLDKFARRKKLEDAKADREKEKQLTLATMKCLTKLTDIIKTNCWDSVAVKGREIQGIISSISVQSYGLLPDSKTFNLKLTWLEETKKIIQLFATGDFFDPWVPRTDREMEELINYEFKVSDLEVIQTIKTKYEEDRMDDEKEETETAVSEEKYVWSGTSSHKFVEVDPKHYSQFELNTFLQSHQEIYFIETDIKKLMLWFNKEFSEMFGFKEKEIALVVEKNNRLRHIIKELSFFNYSPGICKTQIYDPEWAPEEDPEMLLKVLDKEVTVEKYISDSEMDLIKKKEAEEERLRQFLTADDFKERALMVMMDGVLEKLWEDEIKKDVPKPKCLVEKDPNAYTEEDLKAIRVYEEAVKFLLSERERYRKLLEAEWTKIISFIRDSVTKFDEKVIKLQLLKLKVESAIGQEFLKIMRIRKRCFDWIVINRRKNALKLEISKTEKKIESLTWEHSRLVDSLSECRNVYESLQNKDKNFDKNFKKEFTEYSPMICEQLYKLSKKRPKLIQKAVTYSTVIIDLGKCAVSGVKLDHMPTECIQYLKDIDALDLYSNAPATVTQQSWEYACKLRRMKIETELKIRACAIDLADAEATVTAYQKAIKTAKEQQTQLQNELNAVRMEKLQSYTNYSVQLVLKKGLVEVPLSGQISDFDECVFVTKDTLLEVNKAIQKIGQSKLKAMKKAANFRKGIIYKEWEHKKLRMEIEDLKSQLQTVEKCQVIKELQAILTGRARGFAEEKGFLYSENELARVKEKFEKAQIELSQKMDSLDQKIEKMDAKNSELDVKIMELHAEVNEMNLGRDTNFEKKHLEENMKVMKKIRERAKLVRKIQEQHSEILLLQTELELLRLKTYPTIKYKMS